MPVVLKKCQFLAWSIYPMGIQLHIHYCYYRLGFRCWAKILAIANVMGGPVTLIGCGYMSPVIWVLLYRKKLHCLAFNCNSQTCNLGQTPAWFCLAKGEKHIKQLWQIHVSILRNPYNNFDKSNHSIQYYSKSWSNGLDKYM